MGRSLLGALVGIFGALTWCVCLTILTFNSAEKAVVTVAADAGVSDSLPDKAPPLDLAPAVARVVARSVAIERGECTSLLEPRLHPCWRVAADIENIGSAVASTPSAVVGVYGAHGRKYAEVTLRAGFSLAVGEYARTASPWQVDDVAPDKALEKEATAVVISTEAIERSVP